jgi:hypothetical protein
MIISPQRTASLVRSGLIAGRRLSSPPLRTTDPVPPGNAASSPSTGPGLPQAVPAIFRRYK